MAQHSGNGDAFEDTGEVDMSRGTRRVWLVKMPQFILDAWKQAGPDAELGRVKVTQHGTTSECSMTLSGPHASGLPKEYTLNLTPAPAPIYAFSEDAQGGVALEGIVQRRGDVGPAESSIIEYRNLVRKRTADSDAKTRGVQQFNEVQLPAHRPASRVINTVTGKRKDVRRVAVEPPGKRERMEEDKLLDLIFERFERRPNYTLKELSDITQQPQTYLKNVLASICIYNKRGPNKNTFELKPEYKHRKKDVTEEAEADKVAASEAFDET